MSSLSIKSLKYVLHMQTAAFCISVRYFLLKIKVFFILVLVGIECQLVALMASPKVCHSLYCCLVIQNSTLSDTFSPSAMLYSVTAMLSVLVRVAFPPLEHNR